MSDRRSKAHHSNMLFKERPKLNIKAWELFTNCLIVIILHILPCSSECSMNFCLKIGHLASGHPYHNNVFIHF